MFIRFYIIFILQIILLDAISAQSFYKAYYEDVFGSESARSLIQLPGSELLLIGSGNTGMSQFSFSPIFRYVDLQSGEYKYIKRPIIFPPLISGGVEDGMFHKGSLYIAGSRGYEFGGYDQDFLIAKLDTSGDTIWVTIAGNPDVRDRALAMCIDQQDNIIVSGHISKEAGSNINITEVIKLNNEGEPLWSRTICGSFAGLANKSVTTDMGDNIYTLGDDNLFLPSIMRLGLSKLSPDGDSLWSQYFSIGEGYTFPVKILTADNGNLIICGIGYFEEVDDGAPFLAELDTAGQVIWMEHYYEEMGAFGYAYDVIKTRDDGYAMTASVESTAYLIRTDTNGKTRDVDIYEGFNLHRPRVLTQLKDGSFGISGNFVNDPSDTLGLTVWLIRTDVDGMLTSATIPEYETMPFQIFPNPSSDILNTDLSPDKYKVNIIDTMGKILLTLDTYSEIDIRHLPPGLYYINVFEGKALKGSRKFVKY